MATVVKDFKIKSGLVVEGTTGTINTYDILTKKQADQDYIVGLIGGTATAENTPDTVVKRDGNGDFAAGTVTATQVTLGSAGYIQDDGDGDLEIVNTDNNDVVIRAEDIRLNSADDVRITAGTEGSENADIVLSAEYGEIRLESSNIYVGAISTDEQRVATQGYVDDAIDGIDLTFNTDEISEGSTNLYFTNQRALDATSSAYDAAGAAAAAETAANTYTDGRETAITTAYQSYADTAETDAVAAAATYTDGEITTALTTAQGYADTAESNAESYADSLIGDNTVDGTAGNTVTDRIATAIADLVDSAPATLDTLNELAAALQDNPDVIGDLQDIAAGKQDTLTAGANIDITGATISVTGLDTDDVTEGTNLYFTDSRAVTANTGLWDTIGAAATALEDAQDYADQAELDAVSTANTYTDTRETAITTAYESYADTAEADAKTYADGLVSDLQDIVDGLSTDDVAEGANLYYTESRAKTDAASLLTGATLTNITITGDGEGLTITAENGVADSDTDDLTEGTTNLYFTDSRAVDALEAVVPNFTAVEFNSVAKQVAAEATVATASTSNALTWAKADYRSAEFLVKIKQGNHTEVSKLVLTMDASDNIAITEYAMVGTNGDLGSYSATVSGTDVALTVTTLNNNSDVMVVGTLLK